MSNEEFEEVYIGDGVYARWDGFSVLLKTERDGGTHYIYLEPQHVESLAKLIESEPRIANEPEKHEIGADEAEDIYRGRTRGGL